MSTKIEQIEHFVLALPSNSMWFLTCCQSRSKEEEGKMARKNRWLSS